MWDQHRTLLSSIFNVAVSAAHPGLSLPEFLPDLPAGRLVVLAAGKAAGAMVEVAERHYLESLRAPPDRVSGLAVTRYGYARPTRAIRVIEAGHPIPDRAGLHATRRVLEKASSAGPDDLVLVLLSGGGSANWVQPVEGVELEQKQELTRALLRSGASIDEINAVRKHLSRIKGGRLARAANPAEVVTLAISDVPGDDPSTIASGPTVPDPTTLRMALEAASCAGESLPESIRIALRDPRNETPKPGDPVFDRTQFTIVATPALMLKAAAKRAADLGFEPILLGDQVQGEARNVAREHAQIARDVARESRRAAIISGGELTVTVRGRGEGGPNQEYALALATCLGGVPGVAALAGDTDGSDGGSGSLQEPAGAFVFPDTLERGRGLGLDPVAHLANNDSGAFFRRLGDLLETGPTYTNVNDLRVILVGATDL